eukprot:Gb_09835 [translate_table: standard]
MKYCCGRDINVLKQPKKNIYESTISCLKYQGTQSVPHWRDMDRWIRELVNSVHIPLEWPVNLWDTPVLLPGAIVQIRCTSPTTSKIYHLQCVKLVEQELWQREGKDLIGVFPVKDIQAKGTPTSTILLPGFQEGITFSSNRRVYNDLAITTDK